MNVESRFSVPAHVVARRVGDETVLLDLKSGVYFGLDPVGARFWELVEEGHRLPELITALLDEYEVEEEVLDKDIRGLINELCARGLLEFQSID